MTEQAVPGWATARGLMHGSFRTLVAGQSLGQLGDGLAQMSFAQLILFDIGRAATPARIAFVLAVTLLPFALVGPVAGALVDRWDRRRTLVLLSRGRALIAAAAAVVALSRLEPAAYVGVVLLLSASRFVLTAKSAALPRTVPAEQLVPANAVSSLAGLAASFSGGVLGAVLAGLTSVAGFVAAALAYLLAGVVLARLPAVGGGQLAERLGAALAPVAAEMVAGLRYVARTAVVRRPLLAVWAHRTLLGGGFVVLVLVADRRYHLQASGYGVALAVTGVAAFAGSVAAPVLAARWPPQALLPLAFLPPAVAGVVAGYWPTLWFLLAQLAVAGFAFQVLKVLVDALVGGATPDTVRGRVFAAYDVLYNVAFVLAALALVPLWHLGAERRLLWWLAAGFALGWLVLARVLHTWPFGAARSRATGSGWPASLLALPAGALPVVAFPRPSVAWFAWVALVPWLLLLRSAPTLRAAGWRGLLGGTGFIAAVHYWLAPSTGPFFVLIVTAVGLLWLPWGIAAKALLTRPHVSGSLLVLPSGWVIVEAVRSWSSLGGPWALLGASQWRTAPVLSLAALGGVWLVSFVLVCGNVAVALLLCRSRPVLPLLVLALALLAGPLWSAVQRPPATGATWQVALVQPGVVHDPQARLGASESLTAALRGRRFDLVVWGESSVGFDLGRRPDLVRKLAGLSRMVGAPLLVNVDARAADGRIRKRAVLVDAAGAGASYDKMRLVPFGEYIPFRDALGWLRRLTKAAPENRSRGDRLVVMHAGGRAFPPLICFESAFPDLGRSAVRAGADLLVVQTATTTFQGSWAADQHASLAAVRAAETGRPVVQASLSGTSTAVDATGRRLGWLPSDRTGVLQVRVPLGTRATPFVRYGDWVPALAFTIVGAALMTAALSAARPRPAVPAPVAAPEPAELPARSG